MASQGRGPFDRSKMPTLSKLLVKNKNRVADLTAKSTVLSQQNQTLKETADAAKSTIKKVASRADTVVNIARGFYSILSNPDAVRYFDALTQSAFRTDENVKTTLFSYTIPASRILMIDNVYFYATSGIDGSIIDSGLVEGYVEPYFTIGDAIPAEILTLRDSITDQRRAYFPFLNERIGSQETTFNLFAKSGQELKAYYINTNPSPVAIAEIGIRVQGWLADDIILQEILEQQR